MKKPFYKVLYVQVLAAIVIGVLLGFFFPDIGALMKPLGDGFIKLIKMLIAPVIFCTVVIGIAGMEDMKKVGKVGGIAFSTLKSSRRSHFLSDFSLSMFFSPAPACTWIPRPWM